MTDTEDERTISDPSVVQKYVQAGECAKTVAKSILAKLVEGASVRQLCIDGETLVDEELKNIFRKDKKVKKGVAFPVCICVNNCINHFSPLFSDDDIILKNGDVAKLDMGVHVDGFVSTLAYSVVVGSNTDKPVDGRKADAILAAQYALRAAVKMMKPGATNYSITDAVVKVADSYKCQPVQGMLSFQLQDGLIEGEKTIVQNPSEAQRKEIEKCTFTANEVYAIDCIISTGAGKGREMESRTTIYKRTEEVYKLKLKASKEFFSKMTKQHSTFPFNLRHFEDEKRARMGVQECVSHKLVDAYPVLYEKPTEIVGQFKTTVLVSAKNTTNIALLEFDDALYKSEHKIEDEHLKNLISQYENVPKKKPNKKKKPAATDGTNAEESETKTDESKAKAAEKNGKSAESKSKDAAKPKSKATESKPKSGDSKAETDKPKAADRTKTDKPKAADKVKTDKPKAADKDKMDKPKAADKVKTDKPKAADKMKTDVTKHKDDEAKTKKAEKAKPATDKSKSAKTEAK